MPSDLDSNSDICSVYFNKLKIVEYVDKHGKNVKACECLCGTKIAWKGKTSGYSSLRGHINTKHENWKTEIVELRQIMSDGGAQATLKDFVKNQGASNTYAWLDFMRMISCYKSYVITTRYLQQLVATINCLIVQLIVVDGRVSL